MNGFLFWQDVIERVRDAAAGSRPWIAGGCVRDYMLGVEPKDIDVFVNSHVSDRLPEAFEAVENDHVEYEGLNGIRGIRNFKYQDTDIQVIFVNGGAYEYVINSFDSRINQGCTDGSELVLPKAMMVDIESKTYTIHRRSANSEARGTRFLEKMEAIEPGWTVVMEDNDHNNRFVNPRNAFEDFFGQPGGAQAIGAIVPPRQGLRIPPNWGNWQPAADIAAINNGVAL